MQAHQTNCNIEFSILRYGTRPEGLPLEWETFKIQQWPGIRAQYRRLTGPIKYEFSIIGNSCRFFLLDLYRENGETRIGEMPRIRTKDMRNKFLYAGPAIDIVGWSEITTGCSFILVELSLPESDEITRIAPILQQADPLVRSLLLQFKSLLIDERSSVPDYAETLGAMLRQELKRIDSRRSQLDDDNSGLTPRQLKAAIAYMDDRIDQGFLIADVARELGISTFHFIRMFKRATGLPPHKFFVARRLDRAKDLLRSPHLSISEVAEMSGFSGTTQMTRAFRRLIGTNPSAFRRGLS
jgi:AraC family transcriptional regulator